MIDRHLRWASKHDWFVRRIGNAVIVRDVSTRNGQTFTHLRRFSSFTLLYRWAGY